MEEKITNLIEKLIPISEVISEVLSKSEIEPAYINVYVATDGYIHISVPGNSFNRESGHWISKPEKIAQIK